MAEKLIKSKTRVKEFAEVFTPSFIVRDMGYLSPAEIWENIESTFLEPSCGNGNFSVEILKRKYSRCKTPKDGLKALASVVGIDIQEDNCNECRERLLKQYTEHFPTANNIAIATAYKILQNNIICGDSLKIMKSWEEQTENYNQISFDDL